MMHCPFCGHAAHARTMESIEEIIQPSNRKDLPVPDIPLSSAMQKKYKDYPASSLWN